LESGAEVEDCNEEIVPDQEVVPEMESLQVFNLHFIPWP
jgi:hypothetical protein